MTISFPDPRTALLDLLNLPKLSKRAAFYGSASAEEAFISRYGPLRPVPAIAAAFPKIKNPDDPHVALRILSAAFFSALTVGDQGETGHAMINGILADIFNFAQIDGQLQRPGLKVDILAGTINPISRDLLDAIAIEFMRSYKTIGRCERCQRYFFKAYPSDRYCSRTCAEKNRSTAQRDWMRNYRAQQKREKQSQRRKTRRTA